VAARRAEADPQGFAWGALPRALRESERAGLSRSVRALLRFQRALEGWPTVRGAADATAFVSLYANGRMCGCYGSNEGDPRERLARAFLRAAHDPRFSPPTPEERAVLAAEVSYPLRPRRLDPERAVHEIEVGTDGVALVHGGRPGPILLPHVARDGHLGPADLLAALLQKGRLSRDALREGALFAFETDDVAVHTQPVKQASRSAGTNAAAAWLASMVDPEGRVTFAVDPRTRRRIAFGEMHHGRAASLIQALDAHGGHAAVVARARRRLEEDVRAALGGATVDGWPSDSDLVAGTLALAVLAGVHPLAPVLEDFVVRRHPPRAAWHAAQVVAAIGRRAPEATWRVCVADLEVHPFAPWTLLAAEARGDASVRLRAARGVAGGLREHGPHRGGASMNAVPQTAVTALAVEALARHRAPFSRDAMKRGEGFVRSMQLVGARITAALDPRLAAGAFAATPVVDSLRCDITAHALLALLAVGRRGR
jgi:AMMECR1 domain-containing protein